MLSIFSLVKLLYSDVCDHSVTDGNRNNECSEHIETVSLAVENLLLIATTLPDSQIRNLEVISGRVQCSQDFCHVKFRYW